MSNTVGYRGNQGANAANLSFRNRSPFLWGDFPWEQIVKGQINDGQLWFDDFISMPLIGTQTTQIGYDKYKVYATAGAALTPVSAVNSVELGGGILAATHAADADQVAFGQSYPSFDAIVRGSKLIFECSVAVKSVLTNRNGFFIGLGESNLFTFAAAVPFSSDVGNPTNGGSLLGFHKLSAGTSVIDAAYTDRATSFTNVNVSAGEATMAAFTFTKLGLIYDPKYRDQTKVIRFFQDGVELASGISATTLAATTNLKAKSLGLMFASVAGSAVSTDAFYVDWWACGQVNP